MWREGSFFWLSVRAAKVMKEAPGKHRFKDKVRSDRIDSRRWPSKNIRVTRGKVALHVASCSNRILFDRQPLIHIEPKSPVGSERR